MRLIPLLAPLLVLGCAMQPGSESRVPLQTMTSADVPGAAEAKSCERPAVARSEVSAGFRYGCFCGANYPDLRHPSGKAVQALNRSERRELAAQYYDIRPIDDIDEMCRTHDVCWVLNGDGVLECNEELEGSLDRFRDVVTKGHGFDTKSLQFRCGALALDISFASLSVMQSTSADAAKEIGLKVARIFTSPITAGYALIVMLQGGLHPYPEEGERCSVHELAPKVTNAGA